MYGFKLIKKIKINNCRLNFKEDPCFMYNLESNGLIKDDLEEAFNGRNLLVYRYIATTLKGMTKRKCPWCKEVVKDLMTHMDEHGKDLDDYVAWKMQDRLYGLLLSKVKKGYYFATSYTNQKCQYCIDPIKEGREGMCSVPESARNKVMSFRVMGFRCDEFKVEWLKRKDIVYIIL